MATKTPVPPRRPHSLVQGAGRPGSHSDQGDRVDHGGRRRLVRRLVLAAVVLLLLTLAAWWRVSSAPEEPDGVLSFQHLAPDHVTGQVHYDQTPPVGGDHWTKWLACGAYDSPVPDELAVHSLEHGTLWITYDPALPAVQVQALRDLLPDEGILSPYPGMETPITLSVWDRQLRIKSPDDPRIDQFIAALSNGHTAPEPFNSCGGGVTSW